MRVDAAEFVPLAGASSAEDSWTQGSQPSTLGPQARPVFPNPGGCWEPRYTGAGVASGLSADSPAFVPGAQDRTAVQPTHAAGMGGSEFCFTIVEKKACPDGGTW